MLAPVTPTAAFPLDTEGPLPERLLDIDGTAVPHFMTVAWCCAIGSALLPVVTLPAGLNRAGLPVGVQVIGPFLSDPQLRCELPRSWTPWSATASSRRRAAN